jgi:hypothetical protein
MWVLWNAVLTQGVITAGLGVLAFIVLWCRTAGAYGSKRGDAVLLWLASALVALGAMTGAVAAYLAIGSPS